MTLTIDRNGRHGAVHRGCGLRSVKARNEYTALFFRNTIFAQIRRRLIALAALPVPPYAAAMLAPRLSRHTDPAAAGTGIKLEPRLTRKHGKSVIAPAGQAESAAAVSTSV